MRYGIYLPTRGPLAEPDAIAAIAHGAESMGYTTIVVGDHIVFPVQVESKYPYTIDGGFPGRGDALEQLSLLAYVAGVTDRARLVTSVMILPHRNPLVTAKMLATIDVLSKGRLTVGVGVGWMREEFQALGATDFDQRGGVSDEYLEILTKCWTRDPVAHHGQFYAFEALHCIPHPIPGTASADLDRRPQHPFPAARGAVRRWMAPRRRDIRVAPATRRVSRAAGPAKALDRRAAAGLRLPDDLFQGTFLRSGADTARTRPFALHRGARPDRRRSSRLRSVGGGRNVVRLPQSAGVKNPRTHAALHGTRGTVASLNDRLFASTASAGPQYALGHVTAVLPNSRPPAA